MSAHRALKDLFKAFDPDIGPGLLKDPGSGGTITVEMYGQICPVVTATAEARTLAQPARAGILGTVLLDTDAGDLTLTVTGGYNQDGDTSITFDDAGDFVMFMSVKVGTTYRWQLVSEAGTTAAVETSVIDNLQVDTKAIVSDGAYQVIGNATQEVTSYDGATDVTPSLQVLGTAADDSALMLATFSATATIAACPILHLVKSGDAAIDGTHTIVTDNEILGAIQFHGDDGADLEAIGAQIHAEVEGTPGAGDMPSALVFSTTADAGETASEALRITSAQVVIEGSGVAVTTSDGDGSTNLVPGVQAVGVGAAFAEGSLLLATCSTTNTRAVAPHLAFVKGGAATQVATTAVADNEVLGSIIAYGSDGADFESPAAAIEFEADETTPAAGVMGGLIRFSTTATGGETLTSAMTIDADQQVTIQTMSRPAALAAEHGAGAIGTAFAPRTYRYTRDGAIVTEIHVDLTGLGCVGTAAKDAIGLVAGGAAYIGRYVVATYGIVFRIEMICLELPGEGTATITADVDLGAEDIGTTAYDGPVDDVVINTASLIAGEMASTDVPALTANDYLYLIEGDTAATTGVYNAGQYVIRFYGHPLLT